jgi:hypothetical protein
VEVALHHIAVDIAFGQRARPVGAGVIGDVELSFDIENCDNYVSGLDPEGGASGNIIGFAEFEAGRHDVSVACLPAFPPGKIHAVSGSDGPIIDHAG